MTKQFKLFLGSLAVLALATAARAEDSAPARTYLGVACRHPAPAEREKLQGDYGLKVVLIAPGSPAEAAAVKTGDILRKVDQQLIFNPPQLSALIHGYSPGTTVQLELFRDGSPVYLSAVLAEKPEERPTTGGFRKALRSGALTSGILQGTDAGSGACPLNWFCPAGTCVPGSTQAGVAPGFFPFGFAFSGISPSTVSGSDDALGQFRWMDHDALRKLMQGHHEALRHNQEQLRAALRDLLQNSVSPEADGTEVHIFPSAENSGPGPALNVQVIQSGAGSSSSTSVFSNPHGSAELRSENGSGTLVVRDARENALQWTGGGFPARDFTSRPRPHRRTVAPAQQALRLTRGGPSEFGAPREGPPARPTRGPSVTGVDHPHLRPSSSRPAFLRSSGDMTIRNLHSALKFRNHGSARAGMSEG